MKTGLKQIFALGLCLFLGACAGNQTENEAQNESNATITDKVDSKEAKVTATSAFCTALLEKCPQKTEKNFDIKEVNFTKQNLEEVTDEFGKQYLKSDELFSFYFGGVDKNKQGVSKVYYYGSMIAPEGVDCRVIFATHDSWEEFSQALILVDFSEGGAKLKAIRLANYYAYVGEALTKATIMDNGNIKTVEVVDVPGHEKNETILYGPKLDVLEKK